MAFCDFRVKYDPKKDTKRDLYLRILYVLFIKRIKGKKPAPIFIGGDSGEGKSTTVARLMQDLCEIQGLNAIDVFEDINVFQPLEYSPKLDALLDPRNKRLKKVNLFGIHEARDIIKSSKWQSFLAQVFADVNAQSRAIKPLVILIISQFIKDITKDVRYTLRYYATVRRPLGKKARLYINVMWKDDRDLENPKLRKRRLQGYLVYPNGRHRRFIPEYFEIEKPDAEIVRIMEKADKEAKGTIIRRKLEALNKEMEAEIGIDNKIPKLVDFYADRPELLQSIGRRHRGKWLTKNDFRQMHDLKREEIKRFEELISERVKVEEN
jgi:hypothetical protein